MRWVIEKTRSWGEVVAAPVAGRAGPGGTFAACGAAIIGAAPVEQRVSDPLLLKAQEAGNNLLKELIKHNKKQNIAVIGE